MDLILLSEAGSRAQGSGTWIQVDSLNGYIGLDMSLKDNIGAKYFNYQFHSLLVP